MNFPTISIDLTFFTNILNELARQSNPFAAGWLLLKLGGWVPLLILTYIGVKYLYMDYIVTRWYGKIKFVLLAIDIPKGNEQTPKAVENIFSHFYGMKSSINWKQKYIHGKVQIVTSMEIVSRGGDIQFYIRTPLKYRDLVEAAIYSQYPDAEITEAEDYAKSFPKKFPSEKYEMFGCDFKMENDFIFPIRTYPQFEHGLSAEFKDPMSLILEAMGRVRKDETFAIQILLIPASDFWRKAAAQKVKKLLGKVPPSKPGIVGRTAGMLGEMAEYAVSGGIKTEGEKAKDNDMFKMLAMSPGERKVIEGIEMKISKVGFPCKLRFIQISPIEGFSTKYAMVKGFLKQFAVLGSNAFASIIKTMPRGDYWWQRMARPRKQTTLTNAYANRDPVPGGPVYVLNIEELATLWHFPVIEVKAPKVRRTEAKRAEPPRGLPIR
ncbi:hypothetical protein KJ885_03840 [Patescibacteria group bacterium]|nr:hypothetical protein [Patescibacteria group bacterium]